MVRIFILPVVEPFLQVALPANLIRLQPIQSLASLSHKQRVHAQHIGCLHSIKQALTNHGQIGKATIACATMIALIRYKHILRRGRGGRDQIFLTIHAHILRRYEPSKAELSSTFQHRIIFAKEVLVEREAVVLPDMR